MIVHVFRMLFSGNCAVILIARDSKIKLEIQALISADISICFNVVDKHIVVSIMSCV